MDWRRELKRLHDKGEQASFHDKLTTYKAVRDAGVIHPELAFFSIAYLLMHGAIDSMMRDDTLEAISKRLRELESDPGGGERGKKESEALMRGWELISDDRMEQYFRDHGESEMADLFARNRAEFEARYERGRAMVFGPRKQTPVEE
jgi:hypothetical protein